ncbi:MAG TPA: hypothetical protein VJS64_06060 [Pyrinomonadaceae bacterium]|nr:hypothetical protein [Pyrinomonadaceae bacterium]
MAQRSKKSRARPLERSGVPKEFAIEPGNWPQDLVQVIEDLSDSVYTQAENEGAVKNRASFFAALATRLWRVQQKMLKPGTDEPLDATAGAFRHLLSVFDLLEQEGIQLKDHTNEPFDSGMMVNVIAYEPCPGLQRDMVIETIKPTVFCAGQPIQIAEVIVGTPKIQT